MIRRFTHLVSPQVDALRQIEAWGAEHAAAAAEETAGAWMLELLGLPRDASVGLPTGAGLGNAIGLAAARHAVLAKESWDVEASGLAPSTDIGSP